MKSKRLIALLLSLCLCVSFAHAEESGSIFDDIGSWFSQAWEDSSKWVEQAWGDASKWVDQAWKDAPAWLETAWGDASKWVEQAWKDSSEWAVSIWGDVSTWASGTFQSASGSVSAWWTETFKKVTEAKDQTWGWIRSASGSVRAKIIDIYLKVTAGERKDSPDAGQTMDEVYTDLLKKLNLNDEDTGKVLETIGVYAERNGMSVDSVEQIMLPYLVQLVEDSSLAKNGQIPAIAVAQFLTGIMVEEKIGTEEDAQRMIHTLKETLDIQ